MRPALIVFTAVAAHLLCLLLFNPYPATSGDGAYFLAVASDIARHFSHSINGVPTAYRAPLYPAFLSLWPNVEVTFLAQSVLTTAGALLAYYRIPRFGLAIGLLIATCPFFVAFDYEILAETLTVQTLWAGMLFLLYPKRSADPWVGGVLLGLSILTREVTILLPLVLVGLAAVWFRAKLKSFAFAALAAYLVVLPWQVRNKVMFDTFAVSEGRGGFNLWIGTWERNNDWLTGPINAQGQTVYRYPANAFTSAAQKRWLVDSNPTRDDERFKEAAVDRIKSDAGFVGSSWIIRYPRLWLGTRTDLIDWRLKRGSLVWKAFKGAFWLLNALIIALGAWGLWRKRSPLAIPVLYLGLVFIPFHNSETRYSLPALPFLLSGVAFLGVRFMPSKLLPESQERSVTNCQRLEPSIARAVSTPVR